MFLEISSGSASAPDVGVEPLSKCLKGLVDLVRFEKSEHIENKQVADSRRSQKR